MADAYTLRKEWSAGSKNRVHCKWHAVHVAYVLPHKQVSATCLKGKIKSCDRRLYAVAPPVNVYYPYSTYMLYFFILVSIPDNNVSQACEYVEFIDGKR
jgi:hypothetical protein